MSWKDVEDVYHFAIESEKTFRSYVDSGLDVLKKSSGWEDVDGYLYYKVGDDPYNENILKRYFSHFLNDSRSFLDYIIFRYCEYYRQEYIQSEFPIVDREEKLKGKFRKWDDRHREAVLEFIKKHSQIGGDSRYARLNELNDLRNTGMHRLHIIPEPLVEVDKGLMVGSVGGSVTIGYRAPSNQDPNKAWNPNDYDSVAKFGEFYGSGYKTGNPSFFHGDVNVRFNVIDKTREGFKPIDCLEFMEDLLGLLKVIKIDFEDEFNNLTKE
ncbi:hypothetical protein [Rothia nasimurium]|uniref:hypothetical protein n=1 Tax=Rothia nasimurium TaxID=85336 RepID=UPI001F345933|nr:hypothetical protein [Rothia nasimurium]